MVYYSATTLDRTFAALSDPTRRALIAQLGETEALSVSELARPHTMSLPAVMKHLDVLSEAGLVTREKTGRTVNVRLAAAPMAEASAWLDHYRRFWTEKFDRLAALLEEDACPPPATNLASPSSAASKRRRPRSSPPGQTRKR